MTQESVFFFRNGDLGTGYLDSTGELTGFDRALIDEPNFAPLLENAGLLWRAPSPEARKLVITAQSGNEGPKEILRLIGQVLSSKKVLSTRDETTISDAAFGLWACRFARLHGHQFPKEEVTLTREMLPAELEFEVAVEINTGEVKLSGTRGFVSLPVSVVLGLTEQGWQDLQTALKERLGFQYESERELLTV